MIWIFLLGLLLVAAVFYFNFRDVKHKIGTFLVIAFLVLFVASLFFVYSMQGAGISSFDGLVGFGKAYFSWLGGVFGNVAHISGYAIQQNWGVNSTNITGG